MKNNTLLLAGGGVLALYFFTKSSTGGAMSMPTAPTAANPSGLVGVGIPSLGGHAETVSNYGALVMADPNLSNPNYQMTPQEAQQYATNYLDIRQGVSTWPGGLSQANLQKHWTLYGCAQQRVFVPLQPPSGAQYVPVQQNAASSGGGGSSWVGSALSLAGTVLPMILGPGERLNNAECQILINGACIIKDILPMFRQRDAAAVNQIEIALNELLNQYTPGL